MTPKPRKDAAVHVSLSSDEIVKQLSRAKTPRSRSPQRTPRAPQNQPNPIPDSSNTALLFRLQKAKTADVSSPPPRREGEQTIDQRSKPTDTPTSGVAVGEGRIWEGSLPCQTFFRNNSPSRHTTRAGECAPLENCERRQIITSPSSSAHGSRRPYERRCER